MSEQASQTSTQRRKTQAERREESEKRLLEAAADLIASEGYGAASFERLGQVSGYSRGLASQKFGSKEGLMLAIADFLTKRIFAEASAKLDAKQTGAQKVLAYCKETLAQQHSNRAYFILLMAGIANQMSVQTEFLRAHNDFRTRIRGLIQEGQVDGSVDQALEPDSTAIVIGSTCLGIATEVLLDADLDVDAVYDTALESISRTLQRKP